MKSDIIKKSKQIAIPNNILRKKVDKIANQVFSLVNKETEKQKAVVSVHFGGSYAKETWTPEKIDIDIFVKFKKTTTEKNFETIGKKIGFDSLKKFKPYVRYSEHPFVEADIDGVGVNVVPCYDIKKGEWKSAADRSTFHTEFMSEKLTGSMKDDIRVLKCFLKINGMYGAEIAKQGFSGYVCEVLVYYLGSFENVLKKISKLQNNEMIGESPRKFESPIVIIDPIDRNRNLGAAISIQNVTNFILIARNFLKKNSISYFKEKSKIKIPTEIAKNLLIVNFTYKKRSDDIVYGQIKRASSSIESQMINEGFNVLRNDAIAYDETKASLLFLLESLTHRDRRTGKVSILTGKINVKRNSEEKRIKAFHGLTRSLVNNMVIGVKEGFEKSLDIKDFDISFARGLSLEDGCATITNFTAYLKIRASYANKKLKIEGKGQVKLQNKFEFIDYEVAHSGSDLNLVSNIELSELDIKNQNLIKEYLPKTKNILNLKDHKIKLQYKDSNLSVEGLGKISLDKEFNKINYTFSKKDKKYNFETDLEINDTPIKIDFINNLCIPDSFFNHPKT